MLNDHAIANHYMDYDDTCHYHYRYCYYHYRYCFYHYRTTYLLFAIALALALFSRPNHTRCHTR